MQAREACRFRRKGWIDEADAGYDGAGVADHLELDMERPLRLIREPPLHRP